MSVEIAPVDSPATSPERSAFRIAVVLWIASNVFVSMIAKIATWERIASYYELGNLCQWDCGWYGLVLEQGYHKFPAADAHANWLFHPLLPLLAYPLHYWLRLPSALSLVLTSKLFLLFAIYAFMLMVSGETDTKTDKLLAGSLIAFHPYVIYAHAGYAEPLYFAFISLAFYLARKSQWIASGIMGGLASAARMIGFLFSVAYLIAASKDLRLRNTRWQDNLTRLTGLLFCPLGTALYMLYLYHHTGDALAQVHIHVAWVQTSLANPFETLRVCLTTHHWPRVWGLMSLAAIGASIYLLVLRKFEHAVFLALSVLISLAGGSLGMARYIWWQPPLLYAIYCALRRRLTWWAIYLAFSSGMASFMIVGWFTGHNFVN